ncbi:13780_t:CDS:1, partial [Ambispora leptoticha]
NTILPNNFGNNVVFALITFPTSENKHSLGVLVMLVVLVVLIAGIARNFRPFHLKSELAVFFLKTSTPWNLSRNQAQE